jgi:cell division protein FtsZ
VDFADVRSVMEAHGRALMGTGCAKGEGRARLAAQEAITSPLLDDISVDGATGVLINIVGGPDMKMREIQEAAIMVQEQAHEDANIIFGATIDETMTDVIKVTVIATGFDRAEEEHAELIKQASRQPLEREAPVTRGSAMQPEASAPAHTSRRPAAPAAALQASAPAQSQLPHVRERITFPSSMDHDWDIPTYQRRNAG